MNGPQTQPIDLALPALSLLAVLVGLLAVYSSSLAYAIQQFDDPNYYVVRQALWAVLGFGAMLALSRLDYRRLASWSPLLMLGTLAMVALTLVPGIGLEINGARRWLAVGPLPAVQPSELAKLALIIYTAAWLATRGDRLSQFLRGVVPFVTIAGLTAGLILRQPDFGTAVLILLVSITMFFLAGARWRHLLLLLPTSALAGVLLMLREGYRYSRLQSFLDPWQDPQGFGFHIIQSLIALGSGGLTGVGIGASRQKFFYVPSSHTDAIFAIIGEEVGLLGNLMVMAVLAGLIYRCFRVAQLTKDPFGQLLACGVASLFAIQALVNIGGISRSIPFTGVPLPFVSYGGSSLAANLAAIGLLMSISRFRETPAPAVRRHTARLAEARPA